MRVYIHTHKNLHFRLLRKWRFSACWDVSQSLKNHKFFVSCAPFGRFGVCSFYPIENKCVMLI